MARTPAALSKVESHRVSGLTATQTQSMPMSYSHCHAPSSTQPLGDGAGVAAPPAENAHHTAALRSSPTIGESENYSQRAANYEALLVLVYLYL